jgi:lipopolysaccharide export system permease protein
MGILTRYLIRAHAGPFFFALTALTSMLFLNAIAQRLEDLAGKGLTMDVILDFLVLSIPHTVALTLPMAVLVSVLYAWSDLTANNEITAMKAGGISPQRLLLPMVGVGTIIALGMLVFNDRVLPESNHRLKNLLIDINRKSPTFALREGVVNPIESQVSGQRFFLQATRIDNASNELFDVVIVDSNDPLTYRSTVADSGMMAFNASRTDLYLTLYDGVVYESSQDPPGSFQKAFFDKQIVPLRGIANELDRQFNASDRGDREMTLDMLAAAADERAAQLAEVRRESRDLAHYAVLAALGRPVPDTIDMNVRAMVNVPGQGGVSIENDPLARRDYLVQRTVMSSSTNNTRVWALEQAVNRFRVEIHKKWSLAVACVVFVMLGAPLAVRFPRGGLGLVIAASSVIFAIYWVGLIAGEKLSDRGVAPPAVSMWIPNVVFGLSALLLVRRMGREAATMRGGGWDEIWFGARQALARPFRRRPARRPEPA